MKIINSLLIVVSLKIWEFFFVPSKKKIQIPVINQIKKEEAKESKFFLNWYIISERETKFIYSRCYV